MINLLNIILVMIPYGTDNGDIDIGTHPNTLYPLKLKKPILFFALRRRHLYVSFTNYTYNIG